MKHLKKWLRDQRKIANEIYRRNDDYGRGLKDGLDISLEAARALEKGCVWDLTVYAWLEPRKEEKGE